MRRIGWCSRSRQVLPRRVLEVKGETHTSDHLATLPLGVLGVMGAMLSITGIFGMAAYSVSKRKRELGIRIALGPH
jgi:hypothetical protein